MNWLLIPPVAFAAYVLLVTVLAGIGRLLAGPERPSAAKQSIYSSGEAPPTGTAAPGYRPFFIVALFFAVLHLGVLVLATGTLSPIVAVYIGGLLLALLALLLG